MIARACEPGWPQARLFRFREGTLVTYSRVDGELVRVVDHGQHLVAVDGTGGGVRVQGGLERAFNEVPGRVRRVRGNDAYQRLGDEPAAPAEPGTAAAADSEA